MKLILIEITNRNLIKIVHIMHIHEEIKHRNIVNTYRKTLRFLYVRLFLRN